jgi:hypothetical protein
MYRRDHEIRPRRTPWTVTPRMTNGAPPERVPVHSHSAHAVSPSDALLTRVARGPV